MCVIVKTPKGRMETIEELIAAWGTAPRFDPIYRVPPEGFPPGTCLCPVDLEATAEAAGRMVVRRADGDWEEVEKIS